MTVTIQHLYNHYDIPPQLQEHMLRVTAVAKIICEHTNQDIHQQDIITACLLHDMGNLVKFDFSLFPESFEEKGLDYWKNKQQEWFHTYGTSAHLANLAIAKEIDVSSSVLELIDSVGFIQLAQENTYGNFSKLMCNYADMRVAPQGIVSVEKRLEDLALRYKQRLWNTPEQLDTISRYREKQEQYICSTCSLSAKDIDDTSIEPLIEELRNFPIHTTLGISS